MLRIILTVLLMVPCFGLTFAQEASKSAAKLNLLFLGDQAGHQPRIRFDILAPVLARRGIQMEYTEDVKKLNTESLQNYDGLVLYANIDEIAPEQADALLKFVSEGKGFIPLHCASYCFRNSPEVVALIGGQFREHGTGVFTVAPETDHPVVAGYSGFTSWDETYVHHLHAEKDRVVLEYRYGDRQAAGNQREPWTWVKTFGEGRVFYTAWGHDERTWGKRGFHNLVERGIRWACGDDPSFVEPFVERKPFEMPQMTEQPRDLKPFEYSEVGNKIPNYLSEGGWGEQGEPLSTMQRPLAPEESLRHYVTPVGFAAKLFAAEPELGAKPISMTWDHRGRLWVCQTIDYPNEMRTPGQGNDRVTICEDTDGDGRADKITIFADKLSIPTAIVCYRGGAIVQDGTRTLFLKDTDGDDVADIRETLISGWQMGDTHGGVSNFRYGLDNWIWAMQGYNGSAPRYAGGESSRFHMGFFRFKLSQQDPPQVTELEFVRSTDNNTWGLGISEEGLIFGSTANRNPSVFMPIANRYYERVNGWGPEQLRSIADTHKFAPITDKVRQVDHHGGYTAGAGHALYTARTYPSNWWNRTAFVNGPTGHLTGIFELIPEGAGFRSHSPGNLLASDDEWAAPIMSEVGPDGNVWALDWYNYIVQHNPTPKGFQTGRGNAYESDLRDKSHGRIIRVVYEGQNDGIQEAVPQLTLDAPDQWVAALSHTNMLWRLQAQRLLIERGQLDVTEQLVALVQNRSMDAIGLNPGSIHALWTLHGLGAIQPEGSEEVMEAVAAALKHPSAGVRRNALAVLPPSPQSTELILQYELLTDSDPQVQLAAILALADQTESSAVGDTIADLTENSLVMKDRWLADAMTSAAASHAESFLRAYLKREIAPTVESTRLVARVSEHWARSGASFDNLLKDVASVKPERINPVFQGFLAGISERDRSRTLSAETEAELKQLAANLPAAELSLLITLAGRLGSSAFDTYAEQIAVEFRQSLANRDQPLRTRIEAARRLVALQPNNPETVAAILNNLDLQVDPESAEQFLQALNGCRSETLADAVLAKAAEWTPAVRKQGIRLLLSRPEWTLTLVQALDDQRMSIDELAIDERQTLLNHPDEKIKQAAVRFMQTGGGIPSPNRVEVLEKYIAATTTKGDVQKGLALYQEHCSKCHRHGSLGEDVGPDLTGMAVHPKEELLIHILDPSRSVEGNFRAYIVMTIEGRLITGMMAGESRTSVELIDTTGKREVLARDDIEELRPSMKSVMPEGFEEQMDISAMTDLLEFLTQRGKYLPLDIRKLATLSSASPMFYGAAAETMEFEKWGQKEFQGIPFNVLDPAAGRVANTMMLYGPEGRIPPTLPKQVSMEVGSTATVIHMLGGVGGWSAQRPSRDGRPVMTVRLTYEDQQTEEHILRDGVHFSDYIGDFAAAESQKAFTLKRGYQIRYLQIKPKRPDVKIKSIDFIKADHPSSPITMAITLEN